MTCMHEDKHGTFHNGLNDAHVPGESADCVERRMICQADNQCNLCTVPCCAEPAGQFLEIVSVCAAHSAQSLLSAGLLCSESPQL